LINAHTHTHIKFCTKKKRNFSLQSTIHEDDDDDGDYVAKEEKIDYGNQRQKIIE